MNSNPKFKIESSAVYLQTEFGELEFDFVNGQNYRRPKKSGGGELIAKALGYKQGVREVLDVTAGLCIDSVFLCQLGFHVHAIERHPEIALATQKALEIALQTETSKEWAARLKIVCADSTSLVQTLVRTDHLQAIYMDPMYPESKKSALPRKEMQIFRALLGAESPEDSHQLLEQMIKTGVSRVVVKRPNHLQPLSPRVRHRFEGKTVRYDVY